MFGVYILQSLKNHRYYIGSTDNIERRLEEHNSGYVKATRSTRPFNLKTFISCKSLTQARMFEYRLKQYKRRDIIEKVIVDQTFPWQHNSAPYSLVVNPSADGF